MEAPGHVGPFCSALLCPVFPLPLMCGSSILPIPQRVKTSAPLPELSTSQGGPRNEGSVPHTVAITGAPQSPLLASTASVLYRYLPMSAPLNGSSNILLLLFQFLLNILVLGP